MSKRAAKRTDCHRPGAIVPTDYVPVLHYELNSVSQGYAVPSYGINCELDRRRTREIAGEVFSPCSHEECARVEGMAKDCHAASLADGSVHASDGLCCIIGLIQFSGFKFAPFGGTGKCSICGAAYTYGQVWKHLPTGELIHVGHDCADKYELFANDPEWTAQLDMLKRRRKAYVESCVRAKRYNAALERTPGLREALATDHRISRDLDSKLRQWGSLSSAQIALAFRLQAQAVEARNAPPKPAEVHVAAPEGRQTVRGVLVSKKPYETPFGVAIKGTVKVSTPEGVWLAWGTLPRALLDSTPQVGQTVEFTATLKRGRDAHFALYSRPTGGQILT